MTKQKSDIQIFLAHANEDKPQVEALYRKFKQEGYKPWLDKYDLLPGQEWKVKIPEAIRKSDLFIACLSSISVEKRGYVQRELKLALNVMAEMPAGKIYLIPLKLDQCEIPDLQMSDYGISLRDLQWLDYWEPDGYERLLRSINTLLPTDDDTVSVTNPNPVETMEPDRLTLYQTLNSIMPEQLNQIIFTLNPPRGIIPPFPAAQGQRVDALLNWAEGPKGSGLSQVQQTLTEVLSP